MKLVGHDRSEPDWHLVHRELPSGSAKFDPAEKKMKKRAVVLLSGGVDSTTTLAIAIAEGYEAYALSFDYGQRHQIEIGVARRAAQSLGAKEHRVADIDMRIFGSSALTDDIEVPKKRSEKEIMHEIPVTYVPARNTIFLAYALAWAEIIQAGHIFLGVNAIDYSGYPDCRPEFIAAFETLANIGTKAGAQGARFHIHAPLIRFSKSEIIRKAIELNVDLSLTHSCYDPSPEGLACGECDSCLLRLKGFREAGINDPIRYATK